MKGIIESRGPQTWRIRVFVGRERGKVKYISRTVHGNKRLAERELAELVHEVYTGRRVAASHHNSLDDLLKRWLDDVSPHRSAYTVKEYRRLVDTSISPSLGGTMLDKLTPAMLDGYYRSLRKRGLSDASVRRYHFLLHAALGRAVKWGLLGANPADGATPPPLRRSPATSPSLEAVQRLIDAAESDGDTVLATAIVLGAVTGARRGELCALRWSAIDLDKAVMTVNRSLTVIRQMVSEVPTKTHAARTVSLDETVVSVLRNRRTTQEKLAAMVGVALVPDPFVLSRHGDGSQPCLPNGLTAAYRRTAGRLGLTTHLHELRHFAATTAIAGGADVRAVAGQLSHAGASHTARVRARRRGT